jgi:uncharacterized protein YicC (UPF0701 family)
MSKFEKNMEQIFDIAPSEAIFEPSIKESKSKSLSVKTSDNSSMEQDLADAYQQSKDNLQGIIDQGKYAMEEILEIAKQSQHPRSFEVYGTLLKNVVDANKELLNIQKQMREMDGKKQETTRTTIDKAIFVGSTSELSKLLKNKE